MRTQKFLAMTVVAGFALTGLAACGGDSDATSEASESTETTSESTESESDEGIEIMDDVVIDPILQKFLDAEDKPLPESIYLVMEDINSDYQRMVGPEIKAPFGPAELEAAGYTFATDPNAPQIGFDCDESVPWAGLDEYFGVSDGRTQVRACGENQVPFMEVAADDPSNTWALTGDSDVNGTFQILADPADVDKVGVRFEVEHEERLTQGVDYFIDMMGKPDEIYVQQVEIIDDYMQFAHVVYKADSHIIIGDLFYNFSGETKELQLPNGDGHFLVSIASPSGYSSVLREDHDDPEPFSDMTRVL